MLFYVKRRFSDSVSKYAEQFCHKILKIYNCSVNIVRAGWGRFLWDTSDCVWSENHKAMCQLKSGTVMKM